MPSSHLRMEEATSIIACKSITNGFGRSEITDELDDFVLEIDENEINNEIKSNAIVEDLAIDVLKQQRVGCEEEKVKKFQVNHSFSNGDHEAESLKFDENKQTQTRNNQLVESSYLEEAISTESVTEGDIDVAVESPCRDNSDQLLSKGKKNLYKNDSKQKDGLKSKPTETNGLEKTSILQKSKLSEIIDTNEGNKVLVEEGNTNNTCGPGTQCNLVKDCIDSLSELTPDNFESIDNELDALLNDEQEPSSERESIILEPMDIDSSVKNNLEIENEKSELSPISLEQDVNKADSVEVNISSPSSPIVQMYPALSLQDMDESSFREAVFRSKPKPENNQEMKNNDAVQCEKRNKRECDEETSNAQKKLKLDKITCLKKKSDFTSEPIVKKVKIHSDIVSENDEITAVNKASSKIMNRQVSLDEIEKLKEEIKGRIVEMSPEEIKDVMEGRAKLSK